MKSQSFIVVAVAAQARRVALQGQGGLLVVVQVRRMAQSAWTVGCALQGMTTASPGSTVSLIELRSGRLHRVELVGLAASPEAALTLMRVPKAESLATDT